MHLQQGFSVRISHDLTHTNHSIAPRAASTRLFCCPKTTLSGASMSTFIFAVLLTTTVFAHAATLSQLPEPAVSRSSAALEISSISPELTSIRFHNPEFVLGELMFEGETCQVTMLVGEPFRPDEGCPAVPQVTRLYRIPNTGSVELVTHNLDYELIESYKPYPYHDPEAIDFKTSESYRMNAWYPEKVVEVSEPMIFRDYRVVAVTLYPVQVNPATRQARHHTVMEVDLVSNSTPGINELLNPRTPSTRYIPIYQELISNIEDATLFDTEQLPGSYMIIARDNQNVRQWVDSLAMWRRLSGYDVIVSQRANWTASQMRTEIRNVWINSPEDSPLEYVCLFGDESGTFSIPTHQSEYDHYFALATDGDEIEDFGVGRIPVSMTSQFALMHTKLMAYERTPIMTDSSWFRRAFFAAGTNYGVESNHLFAKWADQQLRVYTSLDSNIIFRYTNNNPIPEDTIIRILNDGVSLVMWRSSYINEIPSPLLEWISGPRQPIGVFVSCMTDDFAKQFVWAGTVTSLRGGVCGIGQFGIESHTAMNLTYTGGFIYSMANKHVQHIGHVSSAAKAWLVATFGSTDNTATQHIRSINLFSDPALSIWTEVPATFTVTHPNTIPVGTRSVSVQVMDSVNQTPANDAVVVLWKGDFDNPDVYTRSLTDDSGRVTVPVSVDSIGTMRLAVTKHNHKPYLIEIPCDSVSQQLSLDSIRIDDDNLAGTSGNNNGILNPGEIIDLVFTASNNGLADIGTSTEARLSLPNPRVTVIEAIASVPPIAAGGTAQGNSPFRVSLAPDLQNRETVLFKITFGLSTGDVESSLEFTSEAPDITTESLSLARLSGPGASDQLSVEIQNHAPVALVDVTGELFSTSPFAQVTQAHAAYSDNGTQDVPFSIVVDSGAFGGQEVEFLLAFEDATEFRDTITFNLNIGQITTHDPTGPDEHGYYAFDNSDSSYQLIEFSYLDISDGIGEDLDIDDPGEDFAEIPFTRLIALPFTFRYYGAEYDTITVCSNGWLAFGNQRWNDCYRNFPMPGINSASNMVAAYWDDLKTSAANQGVWAYLDTAAHRFIVQWKASGGGPSFSDANLDFAISLLDPEMHPTNDGNGEMLFQYADVTMGLYSSEEYGASGCTIGIQDSGSVVGLQYVYGLTYSLGAANVVDGRSILFSTDGPMLSDTSTSVEPEPFIPVETFLHPNFPNPFNPTTEIRFDLPQAAHAELKVFNIRGQVVATLVDEVVSAGVQQVNWDGKNSFGQTVASGVYIYSLRTASFQDSRKMLLIK